MKILVLAENYPSNKCHNRTYIHVRNKYYQKQGIDVTVLSFKAKNNYTFEGIKVISKNNFKIDNYDLLCTHAPNLKHHYLFIKKYKKYFKKIILFFHGQEILKWSRDYPKEYIFMKRNIIKVKLRDLYDEYKFKIWNKFINKNIDNLHLIFVSNYLYTKFLTNIKINNIDKHISIINNSVGELFEINNYDNKTNKEYDFITIRGESLDQSKYGIDIVTRLAFNNPKYKFLVIGEGNYYKYNDKPDNLIFINKILNHKEIIDYLNKSKYGLMPTKQDTQGVLTCELLTFGIPTLTSNLEVCEEIFKDFKNVKLIDNSINKLNDIIRDIKYTNDKNEKYFSKNTISKEVELFKELV